MDLFDIGKMSDEQKYVFMTKQFATKRCQGNETSVSFSLLSFGMVA